jgi:hypothetical protein
MPADRIGWTIALVNGLAAFDTIMSVAAALRWLT